MDEAGRQKSSKGLFFRTLSVFALAGPPFGGLAIIPLIPLIDFIEKVTTQTGPVPDTGPVSMSRDGLPSNNTSLFETIMEPVAAVIWIVVFSYPFGLIPALVTGLVCASVVGRTRSLPFRTAIGSAVAIAGLLVAAIILLDRTSPGLSRPLPVLQALLMFVWPSLAATLVCTWIVRRRWLNRARPCA